MEKNKNVDEVIEEIEGTAEEVTENTVITTVTEKEGLFTKAKKWCKRNEGKLIKIGVGALGFAGGLLVGETIGKCKSINNELVDTDLTDIGLDSKDIDIDEEF